MNCTFQIPSHPVIKSLLNILAIFPAIRDRDQCSCRYIRIMCYRMFLIFFSEYNSPPSQYYYKCAFIQPICLIPNAYFFSKSLQLYGRLNTLLFYNKLKLKLLNIYRKLLKESFTHMILCTAKNKERNW